MKFPKEYIRKVKELNGTCTDTDYINKKHIIIDACIDLFELARELPTFYFYYQLKADNDIIEQYLIDNATITDFEGRELSQECIDKIIENKLEMFHNGNDYNPDGKSYLTFRVNWRMQDICFDNIWKLMTELPIKNSEFVKFIIKKEEQDYLI